MASTTRRRDLRAVTRREHSAALCGVSAAHDLHPEADLDAALLQRRCEPSREGAVALHDALRLGLLQEDLHPALLLDGCEEEEHRHGVAVELCSAPSSSSHELTDFESRPCAPFASHGRLAGIAAARRLTRRVKSTYCSRSQSGRPYRVVKVAGGVHPRPRARLSQPRSPPALRTPTRTPAVCCSITSSPCSFRRRCTRFCRGHTQHAPTSTASPSRDAVSVRPPARPSASSTSTAS